MSHKIKYHDIEYDCVNEDTNFWGKYYLVSFDNHTGWESAICVNADNPQDATDYAADYAESKNWTGYFLDYDSKSYYEKYDEVLYIGNHGLPIWIGDFSILTIKPDVIYPNESLE